MKNYKSTLLLSPILLSSPPRTRRFDLLSNDEQTLDSLLSDVDFVGYDYFVENEREMEESVERAIGSIGYLKWEED